MREASFYEKIENKAVRCMLCRHHCVVNDGKRGLCGVRANRDGVLYSLVYAMPCSTHVDPIEKKPFYHFFPGSKAFSIATVGCNFRCRHCQNHEISQMPLDSAHVAGKKMEPHEVVSLAEQSGCTSISYTYTEPTVFYEYAFDTAILAQERGIFNNFVTNGYMEEEPLKAIRPFLDAANIDLKGFNEGFYRNVCGAELSRVIDAIRLYKSLGIWIELTTLVIPGYNDNEEELTRIARFIKEDLGAETPWHVSAFYPTYKLRDAERTPLRTLKKARMIGIAQGLRHVYTGNVPGIEGEHTYCHECKEAVIKRYGYSIIDYNIKDGACTFCGAAIDGIGL